MNSAVALLVVGFALSLGPGRRVTGRLTYDEKKALSGGWILAAPRAGAEQAAAVRLSRAFISASGGLFSPAAVAARRHGVPAIVLPQAAFKDGALVVERPVFGKARQVGGVTLEPAEKAERAPLPEGAVVSVDAAHGLLIVPAKEDEEDELALDEALGAFEGMADAQALVQWWRGRAEGERSAHLAERLTQELCARVAAGTSRADAVARVLHDVKSPAVRPAVQAALREGKERLAELLASAKEAGSPAAAQRISDEAQALARRMSQLAAAAPGADASSCKAAAAAVERAAKSREQELARRKPLSLAEALAEAGARPPRGKSLGPDVYRAFVDETGLGPRLEEVAQDASLDLRGKAQRIEALFSAAQAPRTAKAVADAAPSAGQVAVTGPLDRREGPASSVFALVRAAWADAWSPEELGRRKRAGKPAAPEPWVSIEAVVAADVSGLAFSRDPATGRADRVIVSAGSDQYVLDRSGSRELMPALVADKRKLSLEQLRRVARAARAAENWLGVPAELSFAFSGADLIALGAKPMEPAKPEPAASLEPVKASGPSQALDVKSLR